MRIGLSRPHYAFASICSSGRPRSSPTPLFQEADNKIVKTALAELHSCSLFQVGAEPRVATTGKWHAPRMRMRDRETWMPRTRRRVPVTRFWALTDRPIERFAFGLSRVSAFALCLNDAYCNQVDENPETVWSTPVTCVYLCSRVYRYL
jgi:hypothetical protein